MYSTLKMSGDLRVHSNNGTAIPIRNKPTHAIRIKPNGVARNQSHDGARKFQTVNQPDQDD